jgi:hypothetical protein
MQADIEAARSKLLSAGSDTEADAARKEIDRLQKLLTTQKGRLSEWQGKTGG